MPKTLPAALYLVATPIGNLGDISYRAVETLKSVSCIYCEDTRVAAKLLRHYDIRTPTRAYHEHSHESLKEQIGDRIEQGDALALISDAGMPMVSDPGFKLVRYLCDLGVSVTAIPGATATLTALQLSGLATDRFAFGGFLATKAKARQDQFLMFASLPATLIFFDTASRIKASCEIALSLMGDRQAAIARELTKLHEEVLRGSLSELIDTLDTHTHVKGEFVLLIERAKQTDASEEDIDMALQDALKEFPTKKAAAMVAEQLGVSKRDLYQRALSLKLDAEA